MPRQKRQHKHLAIARSRRGLNNEALEVRPDSGDESDHEIVVVLDERPDESSVNHAYEHVLQWTEGAKPKRLAIYHGTSDRTQFRRKKEKNLCWNQSKAFRK